jgi:hypothetical protein
MSIRDPKKMKRIDRDTRVNELPCESRELANGKVHFWESEECPPGIAEQFWKQVVDFEKSPCSTHFQQLLDRGVDLPPPDQLNDRQLHAKLWQVIDSLAQMQVFLLSTNHFSDRELYENLWSQALREDTFPGMTCILDLVSSGSDQDIEYWLKYYADEETRARWKTDFPRSKIPPRQKPPYDRDRRLPKESWDH